MFQYRGQQKNTREAPPVARSPGQLKSPYDPGAVQFVGLTKSYGSGKGNRKYLVNQCNALFPAGRKVALLGRNGAGKSTLLRMISGAQDSDGGQIIRYGSVSWPIGFSGSFHPELTGAQNARFVARVHGVDTDGMVAFVHDFTELGDALFMPFRTYSAGMRARLAFAVSMGVPFDCYLVDEVTSVGDQRFRRKCADVFRTRLANAAAIVATHNMSQAKNTCDMGAVLNNGELTVYSTSAEAVDVHRENMKAAGK